jgi:hypothetical protein
MLKNIFKFFFFLQTKELIPKGKMVSLNIAHIEVVSIDALLGKNTTI